MADAMDAALRMDIIERRERWTRLWKAIENRTPIVWGRSFVAALMRTALPAPAPMLRPAAEFAPADPAAVPPAASVANGRPRLTLVEGAGGERENLAQMPRRLN
jgi:hypothetical protein